MSKKQIKELKKENLYQQRQIREKEKENKKNKKVKEKQKKLFMNF